MSLIHDWTSVYPATAIDSNSNMPVLTNDSTPGAGDGDLVRVSQLHALKASLIGVEGLVGKTTAPADDSIRSLMAATTQIVYVDGNRADTYTHDGSRSRPYKTISAALTSITDASSSKRYAVMIAAKTYNEQVTMKAWVDLVGWSANSVVINYASSFALKAEYNGTAVVHNINTTGNAGYGILITGATTVLKSAHSSFTSTDLEGVYVSAGAHGYFVDVESNSTNEDGATITGSGSSLSAANSAFSGEASTHYDLVISTSAEFSDLGLNKLANDRLSLIGDWINAASYSAIRRTQRLYVDRNRADTYSIADGTIDKPYKSIQAAIDSFTDESALKQYSIHIFSGNYVEQLTLRPWINLYGEPGTITNVDPTTGPAVIAGKDLVPTWAGVASIHNLSFSSADDDCISIDDDGLLHLYKCTAYTATAAKAAVRIGDSGICYSYGSSFSSGNGDGVSLGFGSGTCQFHARNATSIEGASPTYRDISIGALGTFFDDGTTQASYYNILETDIGSYIRIPYSQVLHLLPTSATPVAALAVRDSKRVYTNAGATDVVEFTLPSSTLTKAGTTYTFIVVDADGLKVNADSGCTIRMASTVTPAGGYIVSVDIGSTITLVAVNTTEWLATAIVGTWSYGPMGG